MSEDSHSVDYDRLANDEQSAHEETDVNGEEDVEECHAEDEHSQSRRFLIPPEPEEEPSLPCLKAWTWWQIAGAAFAIALFLALIALLLSLRMERSGGPSGQQPNGKQSATLIRFRTETLNWTTSNSTSPQYSNLRKCYNFPRLGTKGNGPLWRVRNNVPILQVREGYRLYALLSNEIDDIVMPVMDPSFVSDSFNGVPWISSAFMPSNSSRFLELPVLSGEDSGTALMTSLSPFQRGKGIILPIINDNFAVPSIFPQGLQVALLNAHDVMLLLQDVCPHFDSSGQHKSICTRCNHSRAFEYAMAHQAFDSIRYATILANKRDADKPVNIAVSPGSLIRLRIVNAASGTNFQAHIGHSVPFAEDGFRGVIVAVDGQWIRPVDVRHVEHRMWVSVGQTLDVIIQLSQQRYQSLPIMAAEEGIAYTRRVGIVLKTSDHPFPGGDRSRLKPKAERGPGLMGLSNELHYHALHPMVVNSKDVDRHFVLHLRGGFINNEALRFDQRQSLPSDHPNRFEVSLRERVYITFVNLESSDGLSMTLHGHVFQVVSVNGRDVDGAKRRVVYVPSNTNMTVAFDAVNPGKWLIHCVEEFRFAAGMAATLEYAAVPRYHRR